MEILKYDKKRSSSIYKPSTSSKNVTINSLINNISNHKIYEQKLKSFLEDIKTNKIQYNLLKILFEYEDNFKLVCDIYQKFIKSKLELEILNFYLKSLGNFISLIHSDEPMSKLDNTINTINKYLRVNAYNKNTILFRIKDLGAKYYILLKGKVLSLIPRKFIKTMTFDEYKNHLNILYILGEDYLLESTMHNNIQSCDIAYSDIDNNVNKILRNMYKNYYCCNYEKYIRLINADEYIKIENYDDNNSNDESEEEENEKEEKNEDKNKGNNENNKNEDKNQYNKNNKNNEIDNNKKKTKSKYYRIIKILNKNFIINKNEKKRNSFDSKYIHLESINNSNYKEDNKLNNFENRKLFKKFKKQMTVRNNKIEKNVEKNNEDINSFNIGIPKELLTKDLIFKHKYKYDGGELPTFFARNKNKYLFYDDEKDEDFKTEEKNKININLNRNENIYYNHVIKLRRNFFIIGYDKVGTISPGMSFGEISLLNDEHKRTSTIFIEEDSMIGRLNFGEYNITIRAVRSKIRTDSINFLLNTKLFGDINYMLFLNKYWIYFQCKKIQKGDFLFKIGNICDNIYIIYNGEIKINSYIDKNNINDLINGIEQIKNKKNKKINYILNQILHQKNNNNKNNNSNSIFERKQKYCLMIGKKGDILGLNDIINYRNNKYICEGEVISDYLSYYEINKTLIFNQLSNCNENDGKNPFNINNIYYIMKTKQDFMLNKLNNIKMTIEQRYKYISEEENNSIENRKIMIIKNKNKLHKNCENKSIKLNKNIKSLSLNFFNLENENKEKSNKLKEYKKINFSTVFKNDIIKENINNFNMNESQFNKTKLSDNNNNSSLNDNKLNNRFSLNLNNNYTKSLESSPSFKNIIKLKENNNFNIKNNLNNMNLTSYNSINNSINNHNNNILRNKSINNSPYKNINNKLINTNEENEYKLNIVSQSRPYEFPKIHDENINKVKMNTFKKNKILKFLFLNENKQKYKLLKYYTIKKKNIHNYFIDSLKSSIIKNINSIENDNVRNNSNSNTNSNSRNRLSDNRYLNYKTEKIKLSSFKLNLKNSKLNNNFKTKNEKVIDIITNDIKPFLKSSSHNELNKNVQVNIEHKYKRNNIPFYKNSLLKKNFYSSLSIKNKMKIKKKI